MRYIKIIFGLLLVSLTMIPIYANDPSYKKWDDHDVKGIYIEIKNESDADLEEDGRYFEKYRRLYRGVYEVEVSEKVSSKLWKIKGTDYFLLFRYNPYLYKFDEGVLEWDGYDGTFYKKP